MDKMGDLFIYCFIRYLLNIYCCVSKDFELIDVENEINEI